jgi:hypothetical protein
VGLDILDAVSLEGNKVSVIGRWHALRKVLACWVSIVIGVKTVYRSEELTAAARILSCHCCGGLIGVVRVTVVCRNWHRCGGREFCQGNLERCQTALTIQG